MELPFVSCICPTFNRIVQLEEMLECFLRQDYRGRKELVILNDCPKQKLVFDHPEVRIYNYSKQYASLSEKHHDLVGLSQGEYITVWDDDDIKLPTALSFCMRIMRNNGLQLFYTDKNLVSYGNTSYRILNRSSIHLTGMWTRKLYDSTNGYHINAEYADGNLQKQFLEKVKDFKEYPIDIPDIYTILRVDAGVAQMTYAYSTNDPASEEVLKYRERILAASEIKDNYVLQPHWDRDYAEIAKKALAEKPAGPFYYAVYDRRENKVMVHAGVCTVKVEWVNRDTGGVDLVSTLPHTVDDLNHVWFKCSKVYHIDWQIRIYANDVLQAVLEPSLEGKVVLIRMDTPALGDTLAWFPYVLQFQKRHKCKVIVSSFHNEILQKWQSGDVAIIDPVDISGYEVEYKLGVFGDAMKDPFHFREKPLQKVAADILGLTYREEHLDLTHLAGPRPMEDKYVVIGPLSTMGCKEWQRPGAWDRVVEHLKLLGYRVVQLPGPRKGIKGVPDMEQVPGTELCPEQDLVRGALTYLAHCEFFVGLASGLAWLARSLNKEVVMVSGFSDAYTEFRSRCWRVINSQVCNSCYNDTGVEYGRHWEWCPREKAFECTREIAPETVNTAVAAASLARSVELPEKPRLLCILPHCSTGGCPQYFLTKLRVLRTAYDVYVVEWSFQGAQFSTQRNQIRMLCKEFIEFDDARHQDLYALVEDLKPEVIHFEELPSMYSRPETLHRLHDEGRYRIFHTSHCSIKQVIRSRPEKYVFPSAAQVAMYGEGEVLEHPVMDKFYAGAPSRDVLCLGILSAHKNQKYVCELARKMPDVQFHFCGATAPNFRDYWKDFLPKPLTVPGERYGFANCTFYGECGPGTLEGLYRRCPVLLHASTLECLPLVFSEALSHGTAVLANWLPIYEHISFKDRISKSRLNLDEDAAKVRELLQVPRVRTEPNYEQFKQRLLDLYS